MMQVMLLAGLAVGQTKTEPAAPAPARITVRMPAGAVLYVDDIVTPRGTQSFETPPLKPGMRYAYTLRAVVAVGGHESVTTRRVTFAAGEDVDVDLRESDASTAKQASPKALPGTPPPDPGIAGFNKEGNVEVETNTFRAVPYTVMKTRSVQGRTESYPTTGYRWVPETHKHVFSLDHLQVYDGSGRKIESQAVAKLLQSKRPVFLARGEKVDPFYLQALKANSLILVARGEEFDKVTPASPAPSPAVKELPAPPEPAEEDGPRPRGPAPQTLLAGLEEDRLVLLHTVTVLKEEARTRTVKDKDGTPQTESYTVVVPYTVEKKTAHEFKDVKAYRGGELLQPAMLKQILGKPTPALVSFDGRPVDPFYLQVIDAQTLILVLPPPPAPKFDAPKAA